MPGKRGMSQLRVGEQRTIWDLGRDDAKGPGGVQEKTAALAIDPGKTNGWAIWTPRIGYNVGQCLPEDVWALLGLAIEHNASAIVYEQFDYRTGQVHADLTPVEVIGVIKEWHRQHCHQWTGNLVRQRPLEAKFFFTDKRLKERGLWEPGKPHSMDALRHLLTFQRSYV